jgi:predicted RNA-binding Zn-ribbon protein involved in translation (DUF1610 family)
MKKKEEVESSTPEHYPMEYTCPNCGYRFTEWFDFGHRASQGVCPRCGVHPNKLYR